MRLSNTLMMNESLLPTGKKAFTLAEVLITLSILGVVAALTIPSLVNRQSDLAAQVKLKKAIANYENVAAVYMVENEATDLSTLGCDNLGNYFKIVEQGTGNGNNCTFITADGVVWTFNAKGNAVVVDSINSPRYGVGLWAAGGAVNSTGGQNNAEEATVPAAADVPTPVKLDGTANDPLKGLFTASNFLNSKASDLSAITSTTKKATWDAITEDITWGAAANNGGNDGGNGGE